MANLARSFVVIAFGVSLAACGTGTIAPPPPQAQIRPVAVQPSAPITLERFRACLAFEDMTKERLDCYDSIVSPAPSDHIAISAPGERIYIGRRFRNDTERLEKLFEFYTRMSVRKAEIKANKRQRGATRNGSA